MHKSDTPVNWRYGGASQPWPLANVLHQTHESHDWTQGQMMYSAARRAQLSQLLQFRTYIPVYQDLLISLYLTKWQVNTHIANHSLW